jgi:hypothetical protein
MGTKVFPEGCLGTVPCLVAVSTKASFSFDGKTDGLAERAFVVVDDYGVQPRA